MCLTSQNGLFTFGFTSYPQLVLLCLTYKALSLSLWRLSPFQSSMLQSCLPGLVSSEDRVDCRLCPAGFSCDQVDGTLSLCPPGQHSPEGVLQCLTCPVDSICTFGFRLKVRMAAGRINSRFIHQNVLCLRK